MATDVFREALIMARLATVRRLEIHFKFLSSPCFSSNVAESKGIIEKRPLGITERDG